MNKKLLLSPNAALRSGVERLMFGEAVTTIQSAYALSIAKSFPQGELRYHVTTD
jgi:hypothetical protein